MAPSRAMHAPSTRRPTPPAVAFAVAVVGIALFSVMDALMKGLVLALGAYTALLWRNLAGAVLSGGLYFARPRQPITRAIVKVHALRAAVSTVMAVCFFWGHARIPMAQAVALTFVAPLLSLYLSAAWLGERIRRATIVASVIAALGVGVILVAQWQSSRGSDALHGAIAVLCSAALYAINIVLMRRQALIADPVEVAFSQSAIVALLLAVGSPWFAAVPGWSHVPMLVVAAVLAVVSLWLLARAYARSDASHLSTSEYTSFVWAAILGWLVFDEPVGGATLAGVGAIVCGCVVALRARPDASATPLEATA